jgi:hypothetical protein
MSEEREGPEDEDDGQYHCSSSFINDYWNLIRILTLRDPILPLQKFM